VEQTQWHLEIAYDQGKTQSYLNQVAVFELHWPLLKPAIHQHILVSKRVKDCLQKDGQL